MDYMKALSHNHVKNTILVIGDIALERYITGKSKNLSNTDSVSNLLKEDIENFPGSAAELALNIKNIGGKVLLAGVVGEDEEGKIITQMLKSKDIPLVLAIDKSRPTTVSGFIRTEDKKMVKLDRAFTEDISHGRFHEIVKVIILLSDDINTILIADYGKGLVTEELVASILEISHKRDIKVVVKPYGTNFKKYRGIDIFLPSFSVMEDFYKNDKESGRENFDDIGQCIRQTFNKTHCQACIVTWGYNGLVLFIDPETWYYFPVTMSTSNNENVNESNKVLGLYKSVDLDQVFLATLSKSISKGMNLLDACSDSARYIIDTCNSLMRDV